MFEKIPISNMTNEEWLQLRKTGIGGSDAGAVCGVNPYSSAIRRTETNRAGNKAVYA